MTKLSLKKNSIDSIQPMAKEIKRFMPFQRVLIQKEMYGGHSPVLAAITRTSLVL